MGDEGQFLQKQVAEEQAVTWQVESLLGTQSSHPFVVSQSPSKDKADSCLVNVQKYASSQVTEDDEDMVIMPDIDLSFDDDLLENPRDKAVAESPVGVDATSTLPNREELLEQARDLTLEQEVNLDDFKEEFSDALRAQESQKVKHVVINRIPLWASGFLLIALLLVSALLALLIVQLYNVPLPSYVEQTLKKLFT